MTPRCWAEIDLDALRHNADVCRAAAFRGCAIMAIVKAGAYGHGLAATARALSERVESFGVANLAEAKDLVGALGDEAASRVLILSPLLPDERAEAIEAGFAVPVSNGEEIAAYTLAATASGKPARLHAVVDTGMGRMGAPMEAFPALIEGIRAAGRDSDGLVRLEGVSSHFPSADEDPAYTREQIARFRNLVFGLELENGVQIHLANSAGLLGFSEEIDFTTEARPGLAIYGVSPLAEGGNSLRPAMAWKTRISLVRDVAIGDSISYGRSFIADRPMRTATLAAGYGDGYPRSVSGRDAEVLIGGVRCPLLGRVTMDQIVVDVSALTEPPVPGDEAVLMGHQGDELIDAAELAKKAGTIPWVILTGITGRVARVYHQSSSSSAS